MLVVMVKRVAMLVVMFVMAKGFAMVLVMVKALR